VTRSRKSIRHGLITGYSIITIVIKTKCMKSSSTKTKRVRTRGQTEHLSFVLRLGFIKRPLAKSLDCLLS